MWWLAACTAEEPTSPSSPPSPTGETGSTLTAGPTGATGDTATAATGDTGPTTGSGMYPAAPYDCALGVPPPPLAFRVVSGVRSTEDIAFDTAGWLVSADFNQNIVRFTPDGTSEPWSPGAGESRGIDLLPDGDVVFTNPDDGTVNRIAATGSVSPITSVTAGVSGIDVAADGTMALGDLNGTVHVVDPTGQAHDWGRLSLQLYGTAFSVDETRIWFASYSGSDRTIYATDRAPDGTWPEPAPWTTFSANGLAGLATDACGYVYAMDAFTCTLWRWSPTGVEERLVALGIPGAYCPALAFGRGLGGWDAYKLYVSTYDEVVEVDVGVPGRPR
jgi:hypothetical protein